MDRVERLLLLLNLKHDLALKKYDYLGLESLEPLREEIAKKLVSAESEAKK